MPKDWWHTNEGQQYLNELRRQKASSSMDTSGLEKAKRNVKKSGLSAKDKRKAEQRIQYLIDRNNKRTRERRRGQKEAETKQKGWWPFW